MYKQAYYRGGAVMNKTKLQWEKLFSEDRERKTKLMNNLGLIEPSVRHG